MRLTKEQIELIDDELFLMGFKFVDIRSEMTDYIASVLEEKDGNFDDNVGAYFLMNRPQLRKQYSKTKRTGILRAARLYFKTLLNPLFFGYAALLCSVLFVCSGYIVEKEDINFFGLCVLMALVFPLLWVGRKNRDISVMRPMVFIHTVLYTIYQLVVIATYSIDDKQLRIMPMRIIVSVIPALMLVLIISLYYCRKQYAGKYI